MLTLLGVVLVLAAMCLLVYLSPLIIVVCCGVFLGIGSAVEWLCGLVTRKAR